MIEIGPMTIAWHGLTIAQWTSVALLAVAVAGLAIATRTPSSVEAPGRPKSDAL